MSITNYNTEILELQDKSLVIDRVITDGNTKTFIVSKPRHLSNSCCIHCGSTTIFAHGFYYRTIKFLSIAGFKSIIRYKQRRFKCLLCHKTFNEDSSLVEKGSTISNASKLKILEETTKKQTFTDVAIRYDVTSTTVNNEFIRHIADYRAKLTSTICIDEFKASTIASEYALIIGDPLSGKILDILPSRRQDYIRYYFQSISDEERLGVLYVVTDLFESYRTICNTLFWKSIHIADRFHWIRQTTEAFNRTRIRIMNSYLTLGKEVHKGTYNKYTKYANVLKKYHKLLLANRYAKELWYFDQKITASYIQKEMSFQEIIEYCLNFDSDLEEAYHFLQDLYKKANQSNYENAKTQIIGWCEQVETTNSKLPELKQVAMTYRSWINPIVNSFILNPTTQKRMTNGFIEGKNNFCKVIKRIGFGYKNFDTFRARILYANDNERPFKN